MKFILLTIITLIMLSGCSYTAGTAEVNKGFFKSTKDVQEREYEEIGNVSLVKNGWLLSSCDNMGKSSIDELEEKAKSLGADAVIDANWDGGDGVRTKHPQCHTAWGWALLWPAWLIPGTSDATVSGTMIKYTSDRIVNRKKVETNQVTEGRLKNQYTFNNNKRQNHDSFALIIGINEYSENTNVEYADLSAMAFEELANKTLGVPKENIITLLNSKATSGQIKAKIELIKELSDRRGNLYIYFAGHGVPGKNGSTYLLPSDMSADSIHLEPNLKLDNIYKKLGKAQAKNVFVFMDSCFSGKDDKGSLLYKGVAPVLRTKKTRISSNKLTILTAGKSTDFANDYEDKKQRMFTYYLIKELSKGKKNLNKIYPDLKSDVKRASLRKGIGYKQVPQIYGNKKVSLY